MAIYTKKFREPVWRWEGGGLQKGVWTCRLLEGPFVHKVGGYDSGSDIGRGLYELADTRDGGHAGPTSFFTKLCGIRQKAKILHSDFGTKVSGEGLIRSPVG